MREFPQPKGLDGAAASIHQDRRVLRWRRLSTLVSAWPRGDSPQKDLASGRLFASTLTKVRMAESGEWLDLISGATSLHGLRQLLDRARQEMGQGATELAKFRRHRWSTWCAEQISKGAPKLFKWVRDGSKELAPPPCEPRLYDGAAQQPGLGRRLLAIHDTWWKFWDPLGGQIPSHRFCNWAGELRKLQRPPEPKTLTAEDLAFVVASWGSSKAPGMDGWTPAELKDWPVGLLALLADIYAEVEKQGRWPADLSCNMVAMLPKGGTADPADRRPVVLLPVVYRLWAALRAAEMRLWLAKTGVLRPDGALRAADSQAYELGLILAEAKAQEKVLAGLATDWSKCYDRLPLGVLGEVAEASGISPRVSGPMLAAYANPRRVCVDGLLGKGASPTCGLAPGCPAATDWLALVMYPWLGKGQGPKCGRRCQGVRGRPDRVVGIRGVRSGRSVSGDAHR